MSSRILLPVRLVVGAASLYAIVRWVVSPAELLAVATTADPEWLLLAAALTPVGVLLQWWKWRRLVQAGLPDIGELDILRSLFTGFGLGLLTPGRLGELGRGTGWPGVRRRATALAAADRLLSSLVTLTAGAVYVLWVMPVFWGGMAGLGIGLGLAILGVCWRRFGSRLVMSIVDVPRTSWVGNLIAAVLFNFVFCVQMFCLLRSTDVIAPGVLGAVPAMFALKTLLPISFMDLGVREAASVVVFGSVGVAAATAVQASLMLFGLNVLLPGLAGLLLMSFGSHAVRFSPPSQRVEFAHGR